MAAISPFVAVLLEQGTEHRSQHFVAEPVEKFTPDGQGAAPRAWVKHSDELLVSPLLVRCASSVESDEALGRIDAACEWIRRERDEDDDRQQVMVLAARDGFEVMATSRLGWWGSAECPAEAAPGGVIATMLAAVEPGSTGPLRLRAAWGAPGSARLLAEALAGTPENAFARGIFAGLALLWSSPAAPPRQARLGAGNAGMVVLAEAKGWRGQDRAVKVVFGDDNSPAMHVVKTEVAVTAQLQALSPLVAAHTVRHVSRVWNVFGFAAAVMLEPVGHGRPATFDAVLAATTNLMALMDEGFFHGDCQWSNVMWTGPEGAEQPLWIDTAFPKQDGFTIEDAQIHPT